MKLALAAAVAAFSIGSVAHAAVYDIGPITDGLTYSPSPIFNLDNTGSSSMTAFSDYFNFSIPTAGDELTTAGINLKADFNITGIELNLYSGSSTGLTPVGTALGTTSGFSLTPQLDVSSLAAGSYYIQAIVDVAAHSEGSYNLATTFTSAAPEPETWVLMIAGLGLAGGVMRLARRRGAVVAA